MKTAYDATRKLYEPKITEEMVVREIMIRLTYAGIPVWRIVERIPWGKKKSTPGISDLCGVVPKGYQNRTGPSQHSILGTPVGFLFPLPIFGEVKRPGGKRRPSQEAFIAARKLEGCLAGFWECWEHVQRDFLEFGIGLPE